MEYQQLQDEIKAAMKAHDNHRRDILRQVHTELKAIEVNERREVTEADVDAMLKRTIKQTKETLDGSIKAGNNQERTDTLTEQVAILEEYLPRQVEGDDGFRTSPAPEIKSSLLKHASAREACFRSEDRSGQDLCHKK